MDRNKRNRSISLVIRDFINRKSGNVPQSRREITHRFDYLDWKDQKKIISACLASGKTDRDWVYKKLLNFWDKSFEDSVKKVWEKYREEKCAWVVIRNLPLEYIEQNMVNLLQGRNYYFVCRRYISEGRSFYPEFEKFIKPVDYIEILKLTNVVVSEIDIIDAVKATIKYACTYRNPLRQLDLCSSAIVDRYHVISLLDLRDIAWAEGLLEEMKYDNVVATLQEWDNEIRREILRNPEFGNLNSRCLSDYENRIERERISYETFSLLLPKLAGIWLPLSTHDEGYGRDIHALLDKFCLTDEEKINSLHELAKTGIHLGWWDRFDMNGYENADAYFDDVCKRFKISRPTAHIIECFNYMMDLTEEDLDRIATEIQSGDMPSWL